MHDTSDAQFRKAALYSAIGMNVCFQPFHLICSLLDRRPVDLGDFEAAVLAGHDNAIAELLQHGAEFGMIDCADQRVVLIECVVA